MNGEVLRADGGMERIRATMGVCPQFDILWGELTGREHMLLYGAIKVVSSHMSRYPDRSGYSPLQGSGYMLMCARYR